MRIKRKPARQPKAGPPETVSQARTWERVKNRYLRAGLCHKCTAQAAWGHQLGFTKVHPPCEDCEPIVATFPGGAAGGWRTAAREGASEAPTERTTAFPGTLGTPQPSDTPETRVA